MAIASQTDGQSGTTSQSVKKSKGGKTAKGSKAGASAVKAKGKAESAPAEAKAKAKTGKNAVARSGGKKRGIVVARSGKVARAKSKTTRLALHTSRRPRSKTAARRPSFYVPNVDDDALLAAAVSYLGTPYRFGSTGGGSVDCSGFVRNVFSEIGLDLPHSAREQFNMGARVSDDELQPGDLVFFRTYRRGPSHVGIYVGDTLFIHAASRAGEVRIDSMGDGYYTARYLGARRLRSTES